MKFAISIGLLISCISAATGVFSHSSGVAWSSTGRHGSAVYPSGQVSASAYPHLPNQYVWSPPSHSSSYRGYAQSSTPSSSAAYGVQNYNVVACDSKHWNFEANNEFDRGSRMHPIPKVTSFTDWGTYGNPVMCSHQRAVLFSPFAVSQLQSPCVRHVGEYSLFLASDVILTVTETTKTVVFEQAFEKLAAYSIPIEIPEILNEYSAGLGCFSQLVKLEFLSSKFDDESVELLAKNLFNHRNLKVLSLHTTGITDEGICSIAAAVKTIPTLEVFNVGNNEFGDVGYSCIIQAYASNPSIREFWMHNRPMSKGVAQELVSALRQRPPQRLTVNLSGLEMELAQEIVTIMRCGSASEIFKK